MAKFRTPAGEIVEIVGDQFVTRDKNGDEVYEGDEVKMGGQVFIVKYACLSCQWQIMSVNFGWYRIDPYRIELVKNKTKGEKD